MACIFMFSAQHAQKSSDLIMQHRWKRPYIPAELLCVLYAISDELHQNFVSGRSPQITDVGIDTAGAVIGIGLVMLVIFLTSGSSSIFRKTSSIS